MISGYPVWVVFLIGCGVFLASFVDAIGGGGGIISVPSYLLAGIPPHLALGTNKLSSTLGTIASAARFTKSGFADWGLAIPSIILAILGGYTGTSLQLMVEENILKYMLLLVLPAVAVVLMKQKTLRETRGEMDIWKRRAVVWGASLVLGAYDGFYGPGTGTFLLLIFCNFARLDVRTASGNVKLVNLASNIGAVVSSLLAGKVLILLGIITAAFSVAGHYIGAGLTIKNGSKIVRPVILIVITLLAIKVIAELMGIA